MEAKKNSTFLPLKDGAPKLLSLLLISGNFTTAYKRECHPNETSY